MNVCLCVVGGVRLGLGMEAVPCTVNIKADLL